MVQTSIEQNNSVVRVSVRNATEYYSGIVKQWAIKMDGTVQNEDYSSKYWAMQSKNNADYVRENKDSVVSQINSIKNTTINDIDTAVTNAKTSINDRLYKGVDLETKFATEIAQFPTVFDWLDNRKATGNFEGIHVGDTFKATMSAGTVAGYSIPAQTFTCRIVGINTYKNCGDQAIGNMFYIHADEVIDVAIPWNPTANNNGTSVEPHPWFASKAYAILNGVNNKTTSAYNNVEHGADASKGGILQLLPKALQNVMKDKRSVLDRRYSKDGLLTGGTGWDWKNKGKLSCPSEVEIYGTQFKSNTSQTAEWWNPENNLSIQFPWYANNCEHRIKRDINGGRRNWWLSSVCGYNSGYACIVSNYGVATSTGTTTWGICLPLCFCI